MSDTDKGEHNINTQQEAIIEMLTMEKLKEIAIQTAKTDVLTQILKEFDEFCGLHQIGYCVIAEALCGVVDYEDFLPGRSRMEVGMLQKDYDRLCDRLDEEKGDLKDENRFWALSRYLDEFSDIERRLPRLVPLTDTPVEHSGQRLYAKNGQALKVSPFIEISIFNALPDDPQERDTFLSEMKQSNSIYEQVLSYKKDPSKKSKKSSGLSGLRIRFTSLNSARLALTTLSKKYEDTNPTFVARVLGNRSRIVELDSLLPYKKRPFRGISVSCPAQVGIWVDITEKILSSELGDLLPGLSDTIEES